MNKHLLNRVSDMSQKPRISVGSFANVETPFETIRCKIVPLNFHEILLAYVFYPGLDVCCLTLPQYFF